MLVRMNVQISGTRDGADWPAKGDTFEVEPDEAVALAAGGLATAVEDQLKKPGK